MTKKEIIHSISKEIFETMAIISGEPDLLVEEETIYINFGIKVTKTNMSLSSRKDVGNNIYYFKNMSVNYIIEDTSSHTDYKIILNRYILESILNKLKQEDEYKGKAV